jgi:electron transfer flavoprotein alpha subunit
MKKARKTGAVCVIAEINNCRPSAVSLQLVGKARALADNLKVSVEVVLIGDQLEAPALNLISAGADRVFISDSPAMALYQVETYAEVITNIVQDRQPQILLLGSTFMGRELAPIIAARLKTGLTAHCIDLILNENNILCQQIPAYGGLISILCPEKRPQMAAVATGVFPNPELDFSRQGEIERVATPAELPGRVRTIDIIKESNSVHSFSSAAVIVAGGAGACDDAGWCQFKDLARALRAPLGCTRPAVDAGWADLEAMIGQSGKMVSPHVYIGVGVSGELQHMVGIKGAKTMIAINKDPKAPIFEQVDYGIVEDCKTFLPLLIEKINRCINCT